MYISWGFMSRVNPGDPVWWEMNKNKFVCPPDKLFKSKPCSLIASWNYHSVVFFSQSLRKCFYEMGLLHPWKGTYREYTTQTWNLGNAPDILVFPPPPIFYFPALNVETLQEKANGIVMWGKKMWLWPHGPEGPSGTCFKLRGKSDAHALPAFL